MRLIDANRLIQALDDRENLPQQMSLEHLVNQNFYNLVNSQPTVEERGKGEWIRIETEVLPLWKCSSCSDVQARKNANIYNFCPNCGADMRGGGNRERIQ